MTTGDNRPRIISAEEFAQGWDSERKLHELDKLQVSVKGTTLFIPARTKRDFDATHGGPVTHVKYRTFEDQFQVWITPCKPSEDEARPLVSTRDTKSSAQLGFAIPLRKLNIKVPETRMYTFDVERIPVEGGGVVYEISFQDFADSRRGVDQETLAALKKAKAEQAKSKRAQARAARLAKIKGSTSESSPSSAS